MVRFKCFRFICLLFGLLLPGLPAQAAQLFALVSERSAAEWAEAAADFDRRYPGHTLIARTPGQLLGTDPAWLDRTLGASEVVFVGGIFGEAVEWLLARPAVPGQARIAVHSDRRLLPWVTLEGERPFDPLPRELIERWRSPPPDRDLNQWLEEETVREPLRGAWLRAKSYWQQRGLTNLSQLLALLLAPWDESIEVTPVRLRAPVRIWHRDQWSTPGQGPALDPHRPTLFLLDHDGADRKGEWGLIEGLCARTQAQCVAVLAGWGHPTLEAVRWMAAALPPATPQVLLTLQDFVLGGGAEREAVTAALTAWTVPVIKGIRVWEQSRAQWRLSEQGLPLESVHYRVAMPELQGISQPTVLATVTPPREDPLTGLRLHLSEPLPAQLTRVEARVQRWLTLQTRANADKRLAILYYNHPPGRHNIGADNLNVVESLWQILTALKAAGYDTGRLPTGPDALLAQIQQRAVNLPEDAGALATMAEVVPSLSADDYRAYFATLPEALQAEVARGPLAYLDVTFYQALGAGEEAIARRLLAGPLADIRHLLEGADHPARARALDLLDQLDSAYRGCLAGRPCPEPGGALVQALLDLGIEGLRGWGEAPGRVMVWDDKVLIPGLQFGNVFIGPQPPRGWELNEELLHANTSFPPTHQYLGYYHYLRDRFGADALIHLGRHSTYEFLPRRRVGLTEEDYATQLIGDLPSIYPYIVDGVGEGIQAKRRGAAVMVDHLTPPLVATPLYDDLLSLRQLIESFEAAQGSGDGALQAQAVARIRATLERLNLRDELADAMAPELAVRGIGFDEVDDDLLVHEVGHYLTGLQEKFMPLGLHVFGRPWEAAAVETLLTSISDEALERERWRVPLAESPQREMASLLAALEGHYVPPGKGNDPVRTPEALPTGRNFFALDGSLLPTRLGYQQGAALARQARADNPSGVNEREALVLWASDAVRDEGAMIGFGLDMLGVRPVWSRRGIIKSMERIPASQLRDAAGEPRARRDLVFTTSGLFRDLYGEQLVWLDRAVLLALDASSLTIAREFPSLNLALSRALGPLGELRNPGDEPLDRNRVADHWVRDTLALLARGMEEAQAGIDSTRRIFGAAPGSYGAGVNRVVERSGSWQQRGQVGEVYLKRMGHAYGIDSQGAPAHDSFNRVLGTVANTYLGRASNLYGLIDNNDAFDYLGGLNMAVEQLRDGKPPASWVVEHSDPERARVKGLTTAITQEFRSRYVNPAWIRPLMAQGYAGARTLGSEFLEYLWGWQVTSPHLVEPWLWDEVKRVYVDDGLELGLDDFLNDPSNVHVYSNMLAVMLVAVQKGFWEPGAATVEELARRFADLVGANGLPGSGHTRPDHPLYAMIRPLLGEEQRQALDGALARARLPAAPEAAVATSISELKIEVEPEVPTGEDADAANPAGGQSLSDDWRPLAALALGLFLLGLIRARRI